MQILFDQGTPAPLRHEFKSHSVQTAYELGWSSLSNGDLIAAAEREGFDIFVTTDRNLKYQQNLSSRRIAIVVLGATSWPRISKIAQKITAKTLATVPDDFLEIDIP